MCKKIVIKAPSPSPFCGRNAWPYFECASPVQETLLIYFVQKLSLSVVQLLTYSTETTHQNSVSNVNDSDDAL